MTILGGHNKTALRGLVLVIEHHHDWTTKWVIDQVKQAVSSEAGYEIPSRCFVLSNTLGPSSMQNLGISVEVLPRDETAWVKPVFNALRDADAVVASGVKLNYELANRFTANLMYVPLLFDRLDSAPIILPGHRKAVENVARKSDVVVFNSEETRSFAEYIVPALCERNVVIRPDTRGSRQPAGSLTGAPTLLQPLAGMTSLMTDFFSQLADEYRAVSNPPRTLFLGEEGQEPRFLAGDYGDVRYLPGGEFIAAGELSEYSNFVTVIDDKKSDTQLLGWSLQEAYSNNSVPIRLSDLNPKTALAFFKGEAGADFLRPIDSEVNDKGHVLLAETLTSILRGSGDSDEKLTKVVLAGADFKFSTPLVKELEASSNVRYVVDKVATNSDVKKQRASVLAQWANVIITEFLNEQAVWYSENLGSDKRLYVHMHGFEMYGPFPERLNLSNVDQIVVPSESYKEKAMAHLGWPENKFTIIPNGGSSTDLARQKSSNAEFTLGLVGWVPSLKRLDRALDLLELLLQNDKRFSLEVRGAPAWDYTWEWKTPAHQDTYMEVLRRLRTSPELASHVSFTPFSADVGNWYRSIGWILSPSHRESFHLAPVEGMISGAVPVVWEREGADDIFGSPWIFENTEAIAQHIQGVVSEGSWSLLSEKAQKNAIARYDESIVREKWHTLFFEENEPEESDVDVVEVKNEPQVHPAVLLVKDGKFLDAWEQVQRLGFPALQLPKDQEKRFSAWLRGHIRLPNKLLSLQWRLCQQKQLLEGEQENSLPLVLQVAGVSREAPRDRPDAFHVVLMTPPSGSQEASDYIGSYVTEFKPFLEIVGPEPELGITLEEHIERAAADLASFAIAQNCRDIQVEGPYWAVLTAILAAEQTRGKVLWDLSYGLETDQDFFTSTSQVITDEPLSFASLVISEFVDSVLISENQKLRKPFIEMFALEKIRVKSLEPVSSGEIVNVSAQQQCAEEDVEAPELPLVSVILPSYRTDGSLDLALGSIVSQSYPAEKIEILVVLNGKGMANRTHVHEIAENNPEFNWKILTSAAGVANARNEALAQMSGEYVIFLDDDDTLEADYLAALVAMAAPDQVVAGDMIDVLPDGHIDRDTNAVRRVKALGFSRVRGFVRAGLFGACGGKLIPAHYLSDLRFDTELTSGEDVEFLGNMLLNTNTWLVAAHRLENSAYVRKVSDDSISRPTEMSVRFGIEDRLQVAHDLWESADRVSRKNLANGVTNVLIIPQIRMLKQNVAEFPELEEPLAEKLLEYPEAFRSFVVSKLG